MCTQYNNKEACAATRTCNFPYLHNFPLVLTNGMTCFLCRAQIHVGKFAADEEDPGCVDAEAECETWAFGGECKANPKFMLKRCRQSCDACDPPSAGGPDPSSGALDSLIWVRVRVRLGFDRNWKVWVRVRVTTIRVSVRLRESQQCSHELVVQPAVPACSSMAVVALDRR